MAERKLYTYIPESDEGIKWYKGPITGEVYDLLPEKHKPWFVCMNDRGFRIEDAPNRIVPPTNILPLEHNSLRAAYENANAVHIYNSPNQLRNLINLLDLRARYSQGRNTQPDFTYRNGTGSRTLISIDFNWYRVDHLEGIIIEADVNMRDLTDSETASLRVRRATGRTFLRDRDQEILRQAREGQNVVSEITSNPVTDIVFEADQQADDEDIENFRNSVLEALATNEEF